MMHSYDLHFFSLSHPLGFHICQPSRNLNFFLLLLGHDSTLNFHLLTQDLFALQIRCVSSTLGVSLTHQVCLQHFRCVFSTSGVSVTHQCVSSTSGVSPIRQVCLQHVKCVSRMLGVSLEYQACIQHIRCVFGLSNVSLVCQVCLQHIRCVSSMCFPSGSIAYRCGIQILLCPTVQFSLSSSYKQL